ncbi:hypothetical protein EUX98_g3653 [Antrodiella citrinella]|uniref:Uncharacterized protein n=1 Tax=Antrodiella citrinella TaxID=2447956 RepID=A0A4S4MW16_9APHY|nr:hypothetical protein EUX98_g3653 [Antrodiella citrinella]
MQFNSTSLVALMFAVGSLAISVNTPITDQGGAPHTSDLILGVAGTSYTWVADFPAGPTRIFT